MAKSIQNIIPSTLAMLKRFKLFNKGRHIPLRPSLMINNLFFNDDTAPIKRGIHLSMRAEECYEALVQADSRSSASHSREIASQILKKIALVDSAD